FSSHHSRHANPYPASSFYTASTSCSNTQPVEWKRTDASHRTLQIRPGRILLLRPPLHLRPSRRLQPPLRLVRLRVHLHRRQTLHRRRNHRSNRSSVPLPPHRVHRRRTHAANQRTPPTHGAPTYPELHLDDRNL